MSMSGTPSAPPAPPQFSPVDIFGSNVIGSICSSLTLGIVWSVLFSYLHRYPKDGWRAKILVSVLGVLVTIESIVICIILFEICAVHAGDVGYALSIQLNPLGWIRSITGSLVAFMTQLFMINRFMKLFRALSFRRRSTAQTRVLYWTGMIFLTTLAVLCFLAGLANPIYLGILKSRHVALNSPNNPALRAFTAIFDAPLISLLILDVILTILFSLKLQRSRTSFSESNRIIDVLMFVLLRNGFLVTALQLTALVLSQIATKATWSLIPSSTISKVYVLTVLAILTKPRDAQDRPYVGTPMPNNPSNGSSTQAGGGTCKSCRNRLYHRPADLENKYGQFNLTEFLQDSSIGDDELCKTDTTWSESKDFCSLSRLEEGKNQTYPEYDVDQELRDETPVGDIVIQVDKQEEVFISPCDHSRQALHRPKQNVLGGSPFTTESEYHS